MEYFGSSTRSVGDSLLFPQNEVAPCECKPFRSCPWVRVFDKESMNGVKRLWDCCQIWPLSIKAPLSMLWTTSLNLSTVLTNSLSRALLQVAQTISSVTRLSRNHPKRQMAIRFLLDRSCNPGRTLNKVYCCEGGTFPTDAQLEHIKNKDEPNLPEVNIKVKKFKIL